MLRDYQRQQRITWQGEAQTSFAELEIGFEVDLKTKVREDFTIMEKDLLLVETTY